MSISQGHRKARIFPRSMWRVSSGACFLFLALGVLMGCSSKETSLPPGVFLQKRPAAMVPLVEQPTGFKILSDPDTSLDTIILLRRSGFYSWVPLYEDVIKHLREETRILVYVDTQETALDVWKRLSAAGVKALPQRLRFIRVEEPYFRQWARDAMTVYYNATLRQFMVLPTYIRWSDTEDPRYVAMVVQLLRSDIPGLSFVRVPPSWTNDGGLRTDGGYVVADANNIYLGEEYLLGVPPFGDELIRQITGKQQVIIRMPGHVDLVIAPVGSTKFGERTVLISDPLRLIDILQGLSSDEKRLALTKIEEQRKRTALRDEDFPLADVHKILSMDEGTVQAIRDSDHVKALMAVEEDLNKAGVKVVHVPALPKLLRVNGEKTLSFPFGIYATNVVQDKYRKDGRVYRNIYIPIYGIQKVDQAIEKVYRDLGCFDKIYQIPAVIEGAAIGGIRCRVNVIGYPLDQ